VQDEIAEYKQELLCDSGPLAAEAGLIKEVVSLWSAQKNHAIAARRTRDELRELRSNLAERLYRLKAVLAHTGRSGQWTSYLRNCGIPRATADRYVARHEATLRPVEEKRLTEAISTPSENDVHKLFQRLLPQMRRVLTTQEAAFIFASDMLFNLPGIDGDFPEKGVEIYRGEEPSLLPEDQKCESQALHLVPSARGSL